LGLLISWLGVKGLLGLEAGTVPRIQEIGLDGRVLIFTGAVVVLTTFLFGLMPALREARPNPADTLRNVGVRITGDRGRMRIRQGIVVAEVAFGVLLVVGAGLLIRSFQQLVAEDPGFETGNLLFARFTLPAAEYSPEEAVVFFDQLLGETRALPNVARATLLSRPPLRWKDQNGRVHIEGRAVAASAPLCCVASPITIGSDYFETLGLRSVRGRLLGPEDHLIGSPPVTVIDEEAASRWWPGEDPIGQRIRFGSEGADWYTVVGIAENITFDGPGEVWSHFYHSHNGTASSHPFLTRSTYLTVRTSRDPSSVVPGIREIVRGLDPSLAIAGTYTMEEVMDQAVAEPRFMTSILSVFAAMAVLLGAIGVYGVMSYSVALRAGEIGVRRALGAGGGEVVGMILRQSLRLTGLGVLLGLLASLAGTRVLTGFLHEISPTDPFTFLSVAAGIGLIACLAAFQPALRASGVDPLDALRVE
jgi:putative ABC transport system permease protein